MLTCRCIFMFLPLNSKVWLSCLLLASWTLLWSTLCLWQRVEHSTVTCLSGCDMGFPYLASQESTWTWLAVSLVCTVSLGCTWTPVPHWHLKRPSVRFSQAGGGPARLLIKAMSCKIEREGGGGGGTAGSCLVHWASSCLRGDEPSWSTCSPCHCKWVCLCLHCQDCYMVDC